MDLGLAVFFIFCLLTVATILFGAGLYVQVMLKSVLKRVTHVDLEQIPVSINLMLSSKFTVSGGTPIKGKLYIADDFVILVPRSRYILHLGFMFYFPMVLCNDVRKYRLLTGTSNCHKPETFKISSWNSILVRFRSKTGFANVHQSIQIKPRDKSDYPKLKKLEFLTTATKS